NDGRSVRSTAIGAPPQPMETLVRMGAAPPFGGWGGAAQATHLRADPGINPRRALVPPVGGREDYDHENWRLWLRISYDPLPRGSGMTASINERPMCPVCKHRMALARISRCPRPRSTPSSARPASVPKWSASPWTQCVRLARRRTEATAMTFDENLRE